MKKVLCMIALGAICFGTVTAAIPVKAGSDTTITKTKVKKKTPNMKYKKKSKDTTIKM